MADVRQSTRHPGRSLSLFVSVISAVLLVGGLLLAATSRESGGAAHSSQDMLRLVLAVMLYFAGHAFRFVRLSVLVGAGQLRRFLSLYLYVAACSSLIPFKLGELTRINELAAWTGSFWRGLLVVWVERTFDVVALASILVYLALQPLAGFPSIWPLLALVALFAFLSVLVFFMLPEQLVSLNLHVIRSYKGVKAVRILTILDRCSDLLQQFRPLISGKMVTLAVITILIWCLELTALAILFSDGAVTKGALLLVTQFSDELTRTATVEGAGTALSLQFHWLRTTGIGVLGVIGLCFYVNWRRGGYK
jgi:hypothetical protein